MNYEQHRRNSRMKLSENILRCLKDCVQFSMCKILHPKHIQPLYEEVKTGEKKKKKKFQTNNFKE